MGRRSCRARASLAALALALAGCGGTGGGLRAPAPVPLGDTSLAPSVHGLRILVVGDSWARNLGVGLADTDHDGRNAKKVRPREISGIRVYDDTGHPSNAVHDRLGRWILNSIYAELAGSR
jgi:hypothetical protein